MAEEVFLFLREGLEWTIEASKLLIYGMERQASPSVENPQNFAKHIERITCAAPPAAGLKGIVRGGAHDGAAASSGKFIPEHVNAARVGFSGDDDHRGAFFLGESRGDGAPSREFPYVHKQTFHSLTGEPENLAMHRATRPRAPGERYVNRTDSPGEQG